MKKAISLILICAHLTAVFHFTVPYLSYYTNFTYFSTEACINKDNHDVECNGTCQLDKMVHQQHQDKKDMATRHNVDRAPKVDFFFQYRYGSFHLVERHTDKPFHIEAEKYNSLWLAEPLSPPPQAA